MKSLLALAGALAFALTSLSRESPAAPLVKAGGKPGAATSWTSAGKTTTLTLDTGYDAEAIAKAIGAAVPGVVAKGKKDKVVVTGLSAAELLKALEAIEVDASLDDIDAMLSQMQAPGGDEGSGSSIRATKAADFTDLLGKPQEQATGKVVSVKRQSFPLVFVTLVLDSVPGENKTLRVGQKITVVPRVKSKNGLVDPGDKASKLNVGAWYAQPGDRVKVRLEEARKNIWIAAAFDRSAE